jgi:hypothetical protein
VKNEINLSDQQTNLRSDMDNLYVLSVLSGYACHFPMLTHATFTTGMADLFRGSMLSMMK